MKKIYLLFAALLPLTALAQCFSTGTGADGAYHATANTTLAGGIYNYTSFTIDPGVTVSVTGTQPLVVYCTGTMDIGGTLTASGANGGDGITYNSGGVGAVGVAGGGNGGNGAFSSSGGPLNGTSGTNTGGGGNGSGWSGGGGAGYAAAGASAYATNGIGGPSYGDADLTGLPAGSGGGGGSGGYDCGAGGGGAGGGVIVVYAAAIDIQAGGMIASNGGNGGSDGTGNCGGGGGGSGGSILIAASSMNNDGTISAAGGIGGASQVSGTPYWGEGGNGSDGRIRLDFAGTMTGAGNVLPAAGASYALFGATVQSTVPTCSGADEGVVTLDVTGDGPFTYSWAASLETTNPATHLPEGNNIVDITDANGCTIQITVDVPAIGPFNSTFVLTICNGDSVTVGSNTYTNSGTYQDFLTSVSGCDSVVTVYLTVNPVYQTTSSLTICDGSSITVGQNTYTTPGTYQDILTSMEGCDSIVTTNLTVIGPFGSTQTLTICSGESVTVGSSTYTTSGTYLDLFPSAEGCDSTVTTELTVLAPVDVTVTNDITSLTATASGSSFQWIDCGNNDAPIAGETSATFSPVANGNYAVIVTTNNCSDTSACEAITDLGFAEEAPGLVNVYPNPTSGNVTLDFGKETVIEQLQVTDVSGRIVTAAQTLTTQALTIDLSGESRGVYFLQVQVGNARQTLKITKN